jgi:putative FmdB family regulatory protein
MPIYVYKCSNCAVSFEAMLSVAEGKARLEQPCEVCNGKLIRPFTAPAIHMRYSPMHPRHMRGQRGR